MKKRYIITFISSLLIMLFVMNINAKASVEVDDDIIYDTSYEIGGTNSIGQSMIGKYFDDHAYLLKENDLYFLSITLLDNSALSDINISLSDYSYKSGILINENGKKTTYTITLGEEDITSQVNIAGKVSAMNQDVSFTIKLNLDNMTKTSELVDKSFEYPARFVPEILMDAVGDVTSIQNATYKLPDAKAMFGADKCDLEIFVKSPNGDDVDIYQNKIVLTELGEYEVIYKASTSKYKTNLGNDSYTTKSFKVISTSAGSSLVKVIDLNKILPDNYVVQSQRIESGQEYANIKSLLVKKSQKYEITNILLLDNTGEGLNLDANVNYYIKTNPDFNRNNVEVYHLNENGTLEQISARGYGRYVTFEANCTGTFIVLVPGVSFVMPMWGYALIAVGVIILIGLALFLIIHFVKKRHKKLSME